MTDPYRDNPFTAVLHEKDEVILGLTQTNSRLRRLRRRDKAKLAQLEGLYKAETEESSRLDAMVQNRNAVIKMGGLKLLSLTLGAVGLGHAVQYAQSIPEPSSVSTSRGGSAPTGFCAEAYASSVGYSYEIEIDISTEQCAETPWEQPLIPNDIPRGRVANPFVNWPTVLAAKLPAPMPTAHPNCWSSGVEYVAPFSPL